MRCLSAALVLIVLFLARVTQAADPTAGEIRGEVHDRNGKGVPFVNIAVVGTSRGAICDERGRFRIQEVPVGTRTLRILPGPELPAEIRTVQVEAGKVRKISIRVSQAGEWLDTAPRGQRFVMCLERDCLDPSYLTRDGGQAGARGDKTSNHLGSFSQEIDSSRPWKLVARYRLESDRTPLTIEVLDSSGVVVRQLQFGRMGRTGKVEWRGESDGIHDCPPGNYTIRFAAPADTAELRSCLRPIPYEVLLNHAHRE